MSYTCSSLGHTLLQKSKLLLSKKEEGNAAIKRGDIQKAWETYSEALNIDPQNTSTNAKLYCNRALAGSKVHFLHTQLPVCISCVSFMVQCLIVIYLCVQLGKLEEAISDCTVAIELDPNYIRAYQRRARL